MSAMFWVLIAGLLLIAPWLLWPARGQRPEIRGFKRILWWVNAFYCAFWHRLRIVRPAPLPETGPAILIANHTCGIDPMVLQAGCDRVLGFLIAQEFYDAPICRPFCRILGCIPVRRDGHDFTATRAALRALEEGRVMPIFPEGGIHPTSGREIGPGKPGAAFIALHAKVPVVPAYICGTPPTSDVYRAIVTPSQARVVFGDPVDLSRFYARGHFDQDTVAEATEVLMGAIRDLRDGGRPATERPSTEPAADGAGLEHPSSHVHVG
jgi:1-acyl-sn-glycerol-3-phosphate acyltransferase